MNDISRRTFICRTSRALGSGWVASRWPLILAAASVACERRESGAAYLRLAPDIAATLGAVAEQIIPADETPGARDMGVTWFIDALLDGPWSGMQGMLEAGAQSLEEQAGSVPFVELPFNAQTKILKKVEDEPFFQAMRMLTLAGTFAMPSRGGNRDKAGWALIGFEDHHVWQPPFGYYDAQLAVDPNDRVRVKPT